MGSCGQALNVLQVATKNRANVVPPIPDWNIIQFDYNKDISINNSDPQVTQWAIAYGRLQIQYLGTIFQVYPKRLDYTRIEDHYNTKEEKKLKDTILDILTSVYNGYQSMK